jgi:hypothetical protein
MEPHRPDRRREKVMIARIQHTRARLFTRIVAPRQLSLLLAVLSTVLAVNLPETTSTASPAAVVVAENWTVQFKPGPLRLYQDPLDGRMYWYFTYRVTNSTGQDRMFAPRAELFTDKGEIIRSGRGVSSEITKRLRGLLNNPLIEDENQILGDLRQGKENAKDGLIIWPVTDLDSNELTIFITGLSNATERVSHPVSGDDIVLRKTLRLDYKVPGNIDQRGSDEVTTVPPVSTERALQMHDRVPNALWIWR